MCQELRLLSFGAAQGANREMKNGGGRTFRAKRGVWKLAAREGEVPPERLVILPESRRKRATSWNCAAGKERLSRRARRGHGAPLLEAFAAVDRTSLGGFKGNGGFLAALRANGLGFDPLNGAGTGVTTRRPSRLTALTTLGFVFEALVGEEHLFAGGKNELAPALDTLQDLVVIFHALLRDPKGKGEATDGDGSAHESAGRRRNTPPEPPPIGRYEAVELEPRDEAD